MCYIFLAPSVELPFLAYTLLYKNGWSEAATNQNIFGLQNVLEAINKSLNTVYLIPFYPLVQ